LELEAQKPEALASQSSSSVGFVDVFHTHAPYVLRLLRRLGVREPDVEDVAQEVFLVVHAQLPAFEGRSTIKTWLCGICLRKASGYRRKAHRRRELASDALPDQLTASTQDLLLEQHEQAALLQAGLSQLNEKQLDVFVLYEIEELSMLEVARAVGCPRFTAYTRLHSARRALRAFVEKARKEGRLA
jgi:RNA polymerase sigma-70 factor (ECF subfamily)